MEKYGKTAVFSGRPRPDWGSTARVAMAGLGSIGGGGGGHFARFQNQRLAYMTTDNTGRTDNVQIHVTWSILSHQT